MTRVVMFILGLIAFGVGLRECVSGQQDIECTSYSRSKKDDECYRRTPGVNIHRSGLLVKLEGAGGMLAGVFFIAMAAMKRKK